MSWSLTAAPSSKTLWIAWAVEGACIGIGVMLALVFGFEAGGLWVGLLAGAPFAAAATVELARIPLTRGFFSVRGVFWKALALVAILIAGALTAENLFFGFERAFAVRIQEVSKKSQRALDANASRNSLDNDLKQLIAQRDTVRTNINQLVKEKETDQDAANKDADRADKDNTQERITATERLQALEHERNPTLARLERARAACRADPGRCWLVPLRRQQLAELDRNLDTANRTLRQLNDDSRKERALVRGQQQNREQGLYNQRAQLNAREAVLNAKIDKAQTDLEEATRVANDADAVAQSARRTSQMHRLARFFFGADDDAAATRTMGWFSTVAAIVLSTAGSILAATHFRSVTQTATVRSSPLVRSMRGWLARQRRKHSIVKKVEVVREVEKPVEREVVRQVEVVKPELVLVPVPLEATEEERRRIMARAARENGIGDNDPGQSASNGSKGAGTSKANGIGDNDQG